MIAFGDKTKYMNRNNKATTKTTKNKKFPSAAYYIIPQVKKDEIQKIKI